MDIEIRIQKADARNRIGWRVVELLSESRQAVGKDHVRKIKSIGGKTVGFGIAQIGPRIRLDTGCRRMARVQSETRGEAREQGSHG